MGERPAWRSAMATLDVNPPSARLSLWLAATRCPNLTNVQFSLRASSAAATKTQGEAMFDKLRYFIAFMIILVGVALSYGLAIASEPQSLWLWRDVLGVL